MLRINEGDYAYSSGRIRAIEPRLLGTAHFERMLDAADADEAFRVLIDAGYGGGGGGETGTSAFESLLAEELKKTYGLLLEIAPQAGIVKAFQRKYDYFNIKVLLKSEFLNLEKPPFLAETGTIDGVELARMIRERDYKEFDPLMAQTVEEVRGVFSRTRDPQVVDILLDKASFRQLASELGAIDSPYLRKIAEIIIDTTNIKMFMRSAFLGMPPDFARKLIIEGGSLPAELFVELAGQPVDAFLDRIAGTRYGEPAGKGWTVFTAGKSSLELEKLLDGLLMDHIREARGVNYGVEPLVAYLFAKETEIKNVRIIMTCRMNGLPADRIRERLRKGYV